MSADQRNGGIAWTDRTWNPVRGCSRVSEGCRFCYAEKVAARFSGPGLPYEGLARRTTDGKPRWTGEVRLVPEQLDQPLRWKRPRRIFVNSMSDLFHENLRDEEIDRVVAVMAIAARHSFQVLTKRPARMREYLSGLARGYDRLERAARDLGHTLRFEGLPLVPWPLPSVWLGVSVENQETADERIPLLLQTPAAVRFVSYEPALGPVEFDPTWIGWVPVGYDHGRRKTLISHYRQMTPFLPNKPPMLDWIIVGGESGPGARPFDVAWARSVLEQCRNAGVACFVKQLGAQPIAGAAPLPVEQGAESIMRHGEYDPEPLEYKLRDRKGGDWDEWPTDLRVREMPAAVSGAHGANDSPDATDSA